MKTKRIIALGLCALIAGGCSSEAPAKQENNSDLSVERMNRQLITAAKSLPKSESLYFENGLEITGLGVIYDGRPKSFDGCYYFPAIESMTGAHIAIDWHEAEGYSSTVAATLLSGKENLPDILNPMDFGVMELAQDGLIVPLDEYLDLMPDIVAAVGEERMEVLKSADGHIYTIPSVSMIQGSFSTLVRKDWLDKLGMKEPECWEDWLAYWRGVRDNDLNENGDSTDEVPIALVGSSDGERRLTHLMNAFVIAASNDTQFCILPDGTYTMVYEHPRYNEFLEAMAGLYREGILREGYEFYTYASIDEMMSNNTLGSTMTFAAAAGETETLRQAGVTDALWKSVPPITGPYGDRMIQERELVSPYWCITAGAAQRGKAEDIIRFFNWCYTEEGAKLYNYGIEGVSYTVENEKPVLSKEIVANGFYDYRAVGINFEPFGGYWLQDAYMQCLFAGEDSEKLDDIQKETYKGLFVVNNDYFYFQPVTIETPCYVKYRTSLITDGVCKLRDKAIRGEISVEEFCTAYEALKEKGLSEIIECGNSFYNSKS